MNQCHATIELSVESGERMAESNLIKQIDSYALLLPCCNCAAAELNSSNLGFSMVAARHMNWHRNFFQFKTDKDIICDFKSISLFP